MTDRRVTHEPRDDALAGLLGPWLPGRRWFPVKGTEARISAVGGLTLADPAAGDDVEVRLLLLRAEGAGTGAVLQVPLVLRLGPAGADDPALVGRLPDGTAVLDGAGRPEFERAWLAAADRPAGVPPVTPDDLGAPKVLPGEQSNTSVILPGAGPDGSTAMLKVFRGLSDGDNPDVDVPRALADAGWPHVPRPLAWMGAEWPDGEHTAHGHLGVLSAFVPGATDGFELACAMAGRGESFGPLAEELGVVIGQMHRALARALPPGPGTPVVPATGAAVADALAERFDWARSAVPQLDGFADPVAALAERTRLLAEVPARQRVHGDLHLGQVLRGDGTWYVLDFEGEPLLPVAQRTRPDLALRDAAGMLRSFDYAAAVGHAPHAWTDVARTAFLAGYSGQTPDLDPGARAHLLRVLELDKALYEAVYEARNRPDWLSIPLDAVQRLIG